MRQLTLLVFNDPHNQVPFSGSDEVWSVVHVGAWQER